MKEEAKNNGQKETQEIEKTEVSSLEIEGVLPSIYKSNATGVLGVNNNGEDDNFKKNPYLPTDFQKKAEKALGTQFSNVNVYQNSNNAKSLGAKAFTKGNSIHFAPGQYNPYSQKGKKLIAHELVHVVQQRNNIATGRSDEYKQMEDEAIQLAAPITNGVFTKVRGAFTYGEIQMDHEVLGDINYRTDKKGITKVSLDIDSDGDMVFDQHCEITLKDKKSGTVTLMKKGEESKKRSLDFELKEKVKNVEKDFVVYRQTPISSFGNYELHFKNNILKILIDEKNLTVIAKETKKTPFKSDSDLLLPYVSSIEYYDQHSLSKEEEGKNNIFLTDRFFFNLNPFKDKISIHFIKLGSVDGTDQIMPKVAVYDEIKRRGSQKNLDPILIEGLNLDKVTSYKHEEVFSDNRLTQHKIIFISDDIKREIYFSAYISSARFERSHSKKTGITDDYENIEKERIVNIEVSKTPFRENNEVNSTDFLVKGLPRLKNYQLPRAERNLAHQSQFFEAASVDAESKFKEGILFDNVEESLSLTHHTAIIKAIKDLGDLSLDQKRDNISQAAILFFRKWEIAKSFILENQEMDGDVITELEESAQSFWNEIHELGKKEVKRYRSKGGSGNYNTGESLSEARVRKLQYEKPSWINRLVGSKRDFLKLFELEISMTKTIKNWYLDHEILGSKRNDQTLLPLAILLDNTALFDKKERHIKDIKSESIDREKLNKGSKSNYSNFYIARAMFYPKNQGNNQEIKGIPTEIILYRELSKNILSQGHSETWHVHSTSLIHGDLHKEKIVFEEGQTIEKNHKNILLTLDDSDFSREGTLFYQLIPENDKGESKIIHGSVNLKGTDDNYGIFGEYEGAIGLGLGAVSFALAFTPVGPAVFAITSVATFLNSITKAYHKDTEGRDATKDYWVAAADFAVGLFDIIGYRKMKALKNVVVDGKKYAVLNLTVSHSLAGLAGDGINTVLITLDLIEQIKNWGNLSDSEKGMAAFYAIVQGAMLGVTAFSGITRGSELMNMKKVYDVRKSHIIHKPKGNKQKTDTGEIEIVVNNNKFSFDGADEDFFVASLVEYGEDKIHSLILYMKSNGLNADDFYKMYLKLDQPKNLTISEIGLLHYITKGDKDLINQFLNTPIIKRNPKLIKLLIKDEKTLGNFPSFHTNHYPDPYLYYTDLLLSAYKISNKTKIDELAGLEKRFKEIELEYKKLEGQNKILEYDKLVKYNKELEAFSSQKTYLEKFKSHQKATNATTENNKKVDALKKEEKQNRRTINNNNDLIENHKSQLQLNEKLIEHNKLLVDENKIKTFTEKESRYIENNGKSVDITKGMNALDDVKTQHNLKIKFDELTIDYYSKRIDKENINLEIKKLLAEKKAKHRYLRTKHKVENGNLNLLRAKGSGGAKTNKWEKYVEDGEQILFDLEKKYPDADFSYKGISNDESLIKAAKQKKVDLTKEINIDLGQLKKQIKDEPELKKTVDFESLSNDELKGLITQKGNSNEVLLGKVQQAEKNKQFYQENLDELLKENKLLEEELKLLRPDLPKADLGEIDSRKITIQNEVTILKSTDSNLKGDFDVEYLGAGVHESKNYHLEIDNNNLGGKKAEYEANNVELGERSQKIPEEKEVFINENRSLEKEIQANQNEMERLSSDVGSEFLDGISNRGFTVGEIQNLIDNVQNKKRKILYNTDYKSLKASDEIFDIEKAKLLKKHKSDLAKLTADKENIEKLQKVLNEIKQILDDGKFFKGAKSLKNNLKENLKKIKLFLSGWKKIAKASNKEDLEKRLAKMETELIENKVVLSEDYFNKLISLVFETYDLKDL